MPWFFDNLLSTLKGGTCWPESPLEVSGVEQALTVGPLPSIFSSFGYVLELLAAAMSTPAPVDFAQVVQNARKQGIDLGAIAIFYSGLSSEEIDSMQAERLITHQAAESGTVIARFRSDGTAAFPSKATSVLYLAAD